MSAPKFKFASGGRSNEITKVEFSSETAKMVVIISVGLSGSRYGRLKAKNSQDECYFDTWAEAKELLITRAERKLTAACRALELAQSELGNIKGIKLPKDAP